MFASLTSQIGLGVMLLVGVTAMLAGRWPERFTGGTIALAWVLSELLEDFDFSHKAQPAIFAIDCMLAAALLVLLLVTSRHWVVWAFAYQMLIVLTHIGAALQTDISRWDFFIGYYVWSYAVLASLLAGVLFEARPPDPAPFPPRRHSVVARSERSR